MRTAIFWLAAISLVFAVPAFAQETANPIDALNPASATYGGSTYPGELYNFLDNEDANRWAEQGFGNFVSTVANSSACLGATGASLTMTPTACVAYNDGYRSTETGSITFPNSSTCWTAMDDATSGANPNLPNFTRAGSTHYLIDCVDVSQPAMAANSQLLMEVTTSGGAITVVTDKRTTSPFASTTTPVSGGGTGRTTLTQHGILIGEGTSPINQVTCANNDFLAGVTSADPACRALAASDVPGVDSVTVTGAPSTGQLLVATSSSTAHWASSSNRVTLQTGAPLFTYSNTATETSIFSFTLPGGTLTATGVMHCHLEGNYENDSGLSSSLTFTYYYGGVSIGTVGYSQPVSGTSLKPWSLEFNLSTLGTTNAEEGFLGLLESGASDLNAALTVDSTANQTVEISGILGNSGTATQVLNVYSGYCQLQ